MYGAVGTQRLPEKRPAPGCPLWPRWLQLAAGLFPLSVLAGGQRSSHPVPFPVWQCLRQPLLGWASWGPGAVLVNRARLADQGGLGEKGVRPPGTPLQPAAKTQCHRLARPLPVSGPGDGKGRVGRGLAAQAGAGARCRLRRSWMGLQRGAGGSGAGALCLGSSGHGFFVLFLDSAFLDPSPGS